MLKKILNKAQDSRLITLYKELTHSDLKGNIEFEANVRNLYTILCIDKASAKLKLNLPENAYGIIAKQITRILASLGTDYFNGENYSIVSPYAVTLAFLRYLSASKKKIDEIDRIGSYELAQDIIRILRKEEG